MNTFRANNEISESTSVAIIEDSGKIMNSKKSTLAVFMKIDIYLYFILIVIIRILLFKIYNYITTGPAQFYPPE